jgi:hypothetical protein
MRRIIIICAALFADFHVADAAYFLSSEYKEEFLEGQEEKKVVLRNKASADFDKNRGASVTVLSFSGKRKDQYTWNIRTSSDNGISLTAGNFYTQFGSGLLTGRIKPYMPDPFAEEEDTHADEVIIPCNSGYPAFSYYGAALSFETAGDTVYKGLYVYGSRALRYFCDEENTTGSSYSTILANLSAEGNNVSPVHARAGGVSALFIPQRYLRVQVSWSYYDMIDDSGKKVLWSFRSGYGYASTQGCSGYAAYSDGAVKGYYEYVLNRQNINDLEKKTIRYSSAYHGKIGFDSERFSFSCAIKKIGQDYYLPYFSTYGKRIPSEGIFFTAVVSPYSVFSFRLFASSDKNTDVSSYYAEKKPSYKESVEFDVTPEYLKIYITTRNIGESPVYPDKRQICSGIEYGNRKSFTLTAEQKYQKSAVSSIHSLQGGCSIQKISLYEFAFLCGKKWIKNNDVLVEESVTLDDSAPAWTSVTQSMWNFNIRCSMKTDVLYGGIRYTMQFMHKDTVYKKFECKVSGYW